MDFETRAIHVGQEPDPATGAVITPIYQTSTFAQEAVGVHKGYDYARVANPTRTALEECLASLEGAEFGLAYGSGVGAAMTVMHLVDPGQRVVCVNDVYGGTYRMFSQVYEPKGYRFDYVTPDEISTNLAAHLDDDGFVWGRGTCDMKGELATRAVTIAHLARTGFQPSGDLLLDRKSTRLNSSHT